ncbi:4Fe-4S dicluster domain-containing protein, partial [Vibrio breoganii]|uniref:4Fe-4S dicluster domain-containing protein n=1 Tax=Vibrio breoganii TaxID=553239 RepID=UPI0039A407D8
IQRALGVPIRCDAQAMVVVVVNEDICIGCQHCANACPYGAPQYNAKKGHMTKCERLLRTCGSGHANAICVESCPLRALEFGEINTLREKYGATADVAPLPSSTQTLPNIVIKLNKNAKATGDTSGFLANPKEV